ncbi:MAG: acyl-CoA dehydrogenase family protein [Steroidobacteraceae bacterium]
MEHASLEAAELRDAIRGLLSAESGSQSVRRAIAGDAAFRAPLWSKMAELGWFGIGIDTRFGGLGLGFESLAVLYEELGRHLTPIAVGQTLLAAEALKLGDNETLRAQWLPQLASGETSATIALPQVNGALNGSRVGAELLAKGTLDHVIDGRGAQLLLVPIAVANGGRALVAIEPMANGVSVLERPCIDQTRTLSAITVSNVHVSPAQILHLEASDWNRLLDHASLGIASDAIGGATRIFEQTVDYMKTRVQFGRPIGSFQALKARAAHWKIQLEAATALTGRAVEMFAAGDPEHSRWSSDAKFYACDTYAAIAGDAIQLHGGIGFTWEHDCHLFLKRAKLNQMLYGSSVQHKERAAELMFHAAIRGTAVKSLSRVETFR